MKRIIMHWTGGAYKANAIDRNSYHIIFEGDGKMVLGKHPIAANEVIVKGQYAAHTFNCNTGSIGVSMACMGGAKENETNGIYPVTEAQFEAMCRSVAYLSKIHNIRITPETVLSHAEVEKTLKIKQKQKWDFTVLPFKPELKGATACGNYARARIKHYFDLNNVTKAAPTTTTAPVTKVVTQEPPTPIKVSPITPKVGWFGRLIGFIVSMLTRNR